MSTRSGLTDAVAPEDLRGAWNLSDEFGVKAAELAEFGWHCRDLGYQVARSALIPASSVDAAVHAARAPARRRYPRLPTTGCAPLDWREPAQRFADLTEPVLTGLAFPRRSLLRSSLVWRGTGARPPGLDTTVPFGATDRGSLLFDGVHKAYTELCRRRWQDTAPVTFGLIVSEFLAGRAEGTAYATSQELRVELGVTGRESVLAGSARALATTGVVGNRLAALLFGQLAEVAGEVPEASFVEIEFLLGTEWQLIPTQRRLLRAIPGGPAPFHSPRGFRGPVTDLRGMTRDRAELVRVMAGCRAAAVLVPILHDRLVDLFAVLWTLDREEELPAPGALVLLHGTESHAGMVTHLRWLASEILPSVPVYYLPSGSVPAGGREVTIDSDGVRVTYESRS